MNRRPSTITNGGRPHGAGGFTLIEVLVAITALAVIVGIVYGSFSAVINATEQARLSADELRLRQFLARQFNTNLTSVYADVELLNEHFAFVGISESGGGGSLDSVEFCSMAPLMGGVSPPGVVKRVRYAGATGNDSGMTLGTLVTDAGEQNGSQLESSESLVFEAAQTPMSDTDMESSDPAMEFGDMESPGWAVPIESIDFSFYDGADWVEDWDSVAMGRLPWSIRIRINFAKSKEEQEAQSASRYSALQECDFEMVIPVPLGAGYFSLGEDWQGLTGPGLPNDMPIGEGEGEGERDDLRRRPNNTGRDSTVSDDSDTPLTSDYSGRPSEAGKF